MKYHITFKTFEENFVANWAENTTGVVNYYVTNDKVYFHFKWVWEYVLTLSREELVQIMDFNDTTLQAQDFNTYLKAFILKYFRNAIEAVPEDLLTNMVVKVGS